MVKILKTLMINFALIALVGLSSFVNTNSAQAAPATFSVNVTTDESDANQGDGICETANSGECTLRAAIEEANANEGADTIEFTIPGSGVHLIQPGSILPAITEALTIDGYSNNPGATENSAVSPDPINSVINIEIDNASGQFWDGLQVRADDVTIRGLAIDGFVNAIYVDGSLGSANNISIEGNYLGTDATGQSPNSLLEYRGIGLENNCSNITIGGTDPSDRNIVVGSNTSIEILCSNVSIYGNYIGIGRNGVNSIVGETLETGGAGVVQPLNQGPPRSNLIVGGPSLGQANVISGIPGTQLVIAGVQNIVQGNIIGGDYTGSENANLNSGAGISLYGGASNTLIGGTGENEGNIIVGTKGAAIGNLGVDIPLFEMSLIGQNVAILGNSIFEVGILDYYDFGDSNIGIDLLHSSYDGAPSGPPENFFDTGPNPTNIGNDVNRTNSYLRAPVLNSAVQDGDQLSINFDLDVIGSDSNQYRVEFFANDASTVFGSGPGQNYLGSTTVDTGNTQFDLTLSSASDITNKALSATVTPLNSAGVGGFGGTSEFSTNIEIGSVTDFDADGITDEVEDAGPNNGDGNNDGIPDRLQPTVSTYIIGSTYVTFVTQGCSANGSVSSLTEDSLGVVDEGFTYPFGLTDFVLNCSVGDTVEISKYVFADVEISDFEVHKYRPNTETFEVVEEATVEKVDISGNPAILMQYSIEDGGEYDDDGIANGIIVDPVGLAAVFTSSSPPVNNPDSPPTGSNPTTVTGTLPATGANNIQTLLSFTIITLLIGTIITRSARRPTRKATLK